MKGKGGKIVRNPEDAEYVLVNLEASATKELVRKFAASDNHVVLNHEWIKFTITLGRIQTLSKDFCGYRVFSWAFLPFTSRIHLNLAL